MINKTKWRIIAFTMSLLLIIFAIIYGISFSINKNATNNEIYKDLSTIERDFIKFKNYNKSFFVVDILDKDKYVVIESNTILDTEKTNKIINYAITKNYMFSNYNNTIYFKFSQDRTKLIVIEEDDIIARLNDVLLKELIGFLILYILSSTLAVVFSNFIIQPIKDSFYRQKKFISDASHELKTPVAIISANADVIKLQNENEYLDNIKSQTERMKVLVNDMLTLSRIDEDKPKIKKENFSLSDEVLKVILPFDAVAFENGKFLDFNIEEKIEYFGDCQSIDKVLTILLDNAIKYADKNSTIKVSLKKEKSKISISVFNNGSQINDDDSNKIFERFYRGDFSRSRENGGSGLGLSIAKSICDMNKWKISAKSKLNESMLITLVI